MKVASKKVKKTRGTERDDRSQTPLQFDLKNVPKPSFTLKALAKKSYYKICEHLMTVNALAPIDAAIVTMAAQCMAIYIQAAKEVAKTKESVIRNKMGLEVARVKHPGYKQIYSSGAQAMSIEYQIMKSSMSQFMDFSKLLGLDLKSRQSLLVFLEEGGEVGGDPALKLLRKKV